MGCELPEHIRQYYLEVMGITVWQQQEGFSPTMDENDLSATPQLKQISHTDKAAWVELEQSVLSCQQCEELCTPRTQVIFGEGNLQADLLVIGEAPHEEEDLQGQPFVGRIGQLLTAMLSAIEVNREDVFFTNISKCRTPKDRDPSSSEIGNCLTYLRQQIALIQPKAILVLGRVAAQNLLSSDVAISQLRGGLYEFEGIPVFATFHPSFLLHKPSEKRNAWHDLLQLKEKMLTWQ